MTFEDVLYGISKFLGMIVVKIQEYEAGMMTAIIMKCVVEIMIRMGSKKFCKQF